MKKVLLGIIIIVVVILAIGGGVYYIGQKYKTTRLIRPPQTNQTVNQLSDDRIISAINTLNKFQLKKNTQGKYEVIGYNGYPAYTINSITKGDLNNDSLEDAIVFSTGCGASCGSIFTIVINKNENLANAFNVYPDGIKLSSAGQSYIKNITINNDAIAINADIYGQTDSPVNATFNYKLVGNILVKIN